MAIATDCGFSCIFDDLDGELGYPGRIRLSPKAEPDQMERPGRAFDLAVLPVLSDPEPLEQCSNGSAP